MPIFLLLLLCLLAQNREKLDRKTRKNLSKEEDKEEEDKEEKPKRTLTFLGEIKGERRVV